MKIKDRIFDSKLERELYASIKSKWSSRVDILPQVPICKILELKPNEVDDFRRQYFHCIPNSYFTSAHIDYTLCTLDGHPLLSIEFDGMYGGFSSGSTYTCDYQWDPQREIRLNYKLKLATLAGYPLLIVSSKENEPISPGESLTILDGIIGSCIASVQLRSQVEQNFKEMVFTTSGIYSDDDVQNLLSDTETLLELEWDPIAQLAADYMGKCFEMNIYRHNMEWIGEPELPDIKGLAGPDGVQRRIEALKNQSGVGCRVRVKVPNGEVVEEVILRNFDAIHISPLGIAENIAKYRAFKSALHHVSK